MTLTTREADAAFADMVCADPQWLREEFDALIAASFSEPPPPPPPAPPRVPPRPGTPPPPSRRPVPDPALPASPATGPEHRRQRSPPAHIPGRPPGRRPGPRSAARDSDQHRATPSRPGREMRTPNHQAEPSILESVTHGGAPRRAPRRAFACSCLVPP
ncbi:MAG TPA: hypothetical protein VME19_14130 [Streptosporangiaceae bacterium]|nr:hypothetical protein [Streptosporangiaceae bacterium]